jgi:hypothetical protein
VRRALLAACVGVAACATIPRGPEPPAKAVARAGGRPIRLTLSDSSVVEVRSAWIARDTIFGYPVAGPPTGGPVLAYALADVQRAERQVVVTPASVFTATRLLWLAGVLLVAVAATL